MAASSRIALFTVLVLLVLGVPGAQAQEPTPTVPDQPPPACPSNLPPDVNGTITPRRIVYLGSASGAGARVAIQAYKSQDPEGQPLLYSFDVDGDGTFTEFSIPTAAAELITMPGPWVATARVRDPLGAIGAQPFHMDARRFSASTFGISKR